MKRLGLAALLLFGLSFASFSHAANYKIVSGLVRLIEAQKDPTQPFFFFAVTGLQSEGCNTTGEFLVRVDNVMGRSIMNLVLFASANGMSLNVGYYDTCYGGGTRYESDGVFIIPPVQ